MPRKKSIPINRSAHRFEAQLFNQPTSDIEHSEDENDFQYGDTIDDIDRSLNKKHKISGSCPSSQWIPGCCSGICTSKAKSIQTLVSDFEPDANYVHLNSFNISLSTELISPSSLTLALLPSALLLMNSGATIAHFHLPALVGAALVKLKLSLYCYLSICRNSFSANLFVHINAPVPPALLVWCKSAQFTNFPWYGESTILSLNSNAFLSSFSTMWKIGNREEVQSIAHELLSAGVETNLRQYQLEGIHWMWHKLASRSSTTILQTIPLPGWVMITKLPDVYYSEVLKSFWKQTFPTAAVDSYSFPACVLADEMGIGKSLQVISLILLLRTRFERGLFMEKIGLEEDSHIKITTFHLQRKNAMNGSSHRQRRRSAIIAESGVLTPCICGRGELEKDDVGWVNCSVCNRPRHLRCAGLSTATSEYQCLSCTSTYYFHHPIPSKTVLIIIPSTLTNQWLNEIRKHVNRNLSLKVGLYRGKKNPSDIAKLTPEFLSTFDIIFISFKALRSCFYEAELDWTSTGNVSRRYDVFPPSLLGIEFRLVVIDETQNIEGATENMILKMAMKLRTRRKLSVSGTPFGVGTIRDLLHLAQFLRISPLNGDDQLFNQWANFFEKPVLPISIETRVQWLRELFDPFILRRTKDMIREQLGISERFTLVRNLAMSEFEKKLYSDSVQAIHNELLAKKLNDNFQALGKSKIELIRKACCHPRIFDPSLQIGKAGSASSIDKIMIMKVEQTKIRCEEAQRDLLFYLFKLAGIRLLQAQSCSIWDETNQYIYAAASVYQLALRHIDRNRSSLTSFLLCQLVGDESFDGSHVVAPCFSSLLFTWTISEINFAVNNSLSENETMIKWSHSIPIDAQDKFILEMRDSNISTASISTDWFPSVKLGLIHKKSIISATISPESVWKIEEFCKKQLRIETQKQSLVVLFPAEYSLAASDFQDSFATAVSYKTSSPLSYFSTSLDSSDRSQSTILYQASRTFRAKQWKINVSRCHSLVLVLQRDQNTITEHEQWQFSWCPFDELNVCCRNPVSTTVKMWANFAISETQFDTDMLQELHVQYNLRQTLLDLEERQLPMMVPSVESASQLSSLPIISSVTPVATIEDSSMAHSLLQKAESRKLLIETEYLGSADDRRNAAFHKWQEATQKVQQLEEEILSRSKHRDWWSGFMLENLRYCDAFWQDIEDTVERGEEAYAKFSTSAGAAGIVVLLKQEFEGLIKARKLAARCVQSLNSTPTELEVSQVSNCMECRAYFQRNVVTCEHCRRFSKYLQPYRQQYLTAARRHTAHVVSSFFPQPQPPLSKHLTSKKQVGSIEQLYDSLGQNHLDEITIKAFEEGIMDGAYAMLMKLVRKHAIRSLSTAHRSDREADNDFDNRYPDSQSADERTVLQQLVKLELQWVEAINQEAQAMIALWDRYSELLKTHDEIQQCVSRVQLSSMDSSSISPGTRMIESFHLETLPGEFQATYYEAVQAETFLKETVSSLHFFHRQLQQHNHEMLLLAEYEHQKDQTTTSTSVNVDNSLASTDEVCGICQETMYLTEARLLLPCAHRFHAECVTSWLKSHHRCPYCRAAATAQDVRILQVSSLSDKFASRILPQSSQVNSNASQLTVFNGCGMVDTTSNIAGSGNDFSRMLRKVKGRWGTKIDALLADVLLIVHNPSRQEEKGIIFSQWGEMLEIVADAFRSNEIRFTSCFNRQRDFEHQGSGIEAFRHDSSLRFLLMPLHLGAEGLDLIVANHVFLLEPLLNHNQEAQAINRIDRLGQNKHATYVHKYVMNDTIEERIVAFQKKLQDETDSLNPFPTEQDEEYYEELDRKGDKTPERMERGLLGEDNEHSSFAAVEDPLHTPTKFSQTDRNQQSLLRLATLSSTAGSHKNNSRKRKRAAGDDDILGVNDVQFILSLPANASSMSTISAGATVNS